MADKILKGIKFPGLEDTYLIPESTGTNPIDALKNGDGQDSIVINDGDANGAYSIAGGTTDNTLVTNLVGYDISSIPDSEIEKRLGKRGLYIKERADDKSEANGDLTVAYGVGNQSLTGMSNTMGVANQAGSKGFYVYKAEIVTDDVSHMDELCIHLTTDRKPYYRYKILGGNWRDGSHERNWPHTESAYEQLSKLQRGDEVTFSLYSGYSFAGKIIEVSEYGYIYISNDLNLTSSQLLKDISIEINSLSDLTNALKNIFGVMTPSDFTVNFPYKSHVGLVDIKFGGTATGMGNAAIGNVSSAHGVGNAVDGTAGFVTGRENIGGFASLVGGYKNTALGPSSFASGQNNEASGSQSHVEGAYTKASGKGAHAEGMGNAPVYDDDGKLAKAAEFNTSSGNGAHAEGRVTQATNSGAHAEGVITSASGEGAHSQGKYTVAIGANAHAEGLGESNSYVIKLKKHNPASLTGHQYYYTYTLLGGTSLPKVNDVLSFIPSDIPSDIGYNAPIIKDVSDIDWTEGDGLITARNILAFDPPIGSDGETPDGDLPDMDGKTMYRGTYIGALGTTSHTEGERTSATNVRTHAEGYLTLASGDTSHAEGSKTKATNTCAHSENYMTEATGLAAHAEGWQTKATGKASHAAGMGTIASGEAQTVVGRYNEEKDDALFIVGAGSSENDRTNALEVYHGSLIVGDKFEDRYDVSAILRPDSLVFDQMATIDSTYGRITHGLYEYNDKGLVAFDFNSEIIAPDFIADNRVSLLELADSVSNLVDNNNYKTLTNLIEEENITYGKIFQRYSNTWKDNATWDTVKISCKAGDTFYHLYGDNVYKASQLTVAYIDSNGNYVHDCFENVSSPAFFTVPYDNAIVAMYYIMRHEHKDKCAVYKTDEATTLALPWGKTGLIKDAKTQWQGKKWYAYGTSITDTGTVAATGKYVPYLAKLSGMTVVNKGLGSQGFAPVEWGSYAGDGVYQALMSNDGKESADLITIEIGANDGGIMLDENAQYVGNYYDTTEDVGADADTYCGRLSRALKHLQQTTNAQILVIGSPFSATADWKNKYELDKKIEECCRYNGVQYLYPNSNMGAEKLNATNNKYIIRDHTTIHHSELGGHIYATHIWEKLKTMPLFY